MANILLVDDEPAARLTLAILVRQQGHRVTQAEGVKAAARALAEMTFDLVITDLRMPDGNGLEVLQTAKAHAPETVVILLTTYAGWESAKEAMRLGAFDYFEKGKEPADLLHRIEKALQEKGLRRENENLRRQVRERYSLPGIIAPSREMQRVLEMVMRVAPTEATVLIQGESGTGKEVIAKAIHHASPRAQKPFVTVNCGALPETLLESEIFGHVRGAFTGATAHKNGLFEEADGGTFFLDEIGEMPVSLQVKFLRVLQEGEVRRVGANQAVIVNVRVLAATNRDLAQLMQQGKFREALFYRLNVIALDLPPLRERREDILILGGTVTVWHLYRTLYVASMLVLPLHQAQALAHQALALEAPWAEAYAVLGAVYFLQAQPDQALTESKKVLALNPHGGSYGLPVRDHLAPGGPTAGSHGIRDGRVVAATPRHLCAMVHQQQCHDAL